MEAAAPPPVEMVDGGGAGAAAGPRGGGRQGSSRSPGRRSLPPRVAPAPAPAPAPEPSHGGEGAEAVQIRRLSKENKALRQKVKALQHERSEGQAEVDTLIEELSKEIVELTDENRELQRLNEQFTYAPRPPTMAPLAAQGRHGGALRTGRRWWS